MNEGIHLDLEQLHIYIYIGKGHRLDLNSYRGISSINVEGKAYVMHMHVHTQQHRGTTRARIPTHARTCEHIPWQVAIGIDCNCNCPVLEGGITPTRAPPPLVWWSVVCWPKSTCTPLITPRPYLGRPGGHSCVPHYHTMCTARITCPA